MHAPQQEIARQSILDWKILTGRNAEEMGWPAFLENLSVHYQFTLQHSFCSTCSSLCSLLLSASPLAKFVALCSLIFSQLLSPIFSRSSFFHFESCLLFCQSFPSHVPRSSFRLPPHCRHLNSPRHAFLPGLLPAFFFCPRSSPCFLLYSSPAASF